MKSTYYDYDCPRLPEDVLMLEEAVAQTDHQVLADGLQEAMENGYFLYSIHDWGYRLLKMENSDD